MTMTKFESSLLRFAPSILGRILLELEYRDFLSLSQVSRVLRAGFAQGEAKETILMVFLGHLGYCPCLTSFQATRNPPGARGTRPTTKPDGFETRTSNVPLLLQDGRSDWTREAVTDTQFPWSLMTKLRKIHPSNPLEITLQELHAFHRFWEAGGEDRLVGARSAHCQEFSFIQGYCRAHNRLAIRARFLSHNPASIPRVHSLHCRLENTHSSMAFSAPDPAVLRLWIPPASPRMSKAEVLKCEVELLRSGIHPFLRRGDIIWNLAIGHSETGSRLVYDGQHLHELANLWDPAGHRPVSNPDNTSLALAP